MFAAVIATSLSAAAPAASVDKPRRIMAAYIHCLVNTSGFKLRRALELPVGDDNDSHEWNKLATSGCLAIEGTLAFRSYLLRGGIYEVLYKQDFGKAVPIDDFEGVPPVHYPFADADADAASEAARYRSAMTIGDCAVRKAPRDARAVVLSEVATAAEAQAIQAFLPALSACVDQGSKFTLNRSVVRGLAAEALYRLTVAKGGAPHA